MIEIKRCPFCGKPASLEFSHGSNQRYVDQDGNYTGTKHLFHIECTNCLAKSHDYEVPAMAIESWNERAEG